MKAPFAYLAWAPFVVCLVASDAPSSTNPPPIPRASRPFGPGHQTPWVGGDLEGTMPRTCQINNPIHVARFWSYVHKTETCWTWTASIRSKGYGAFVWLDLKGKLVQGRAHVFSWLIHRGEIPAGLFVLHECDTPACVRPEHLFLGTRADNNRDMCAKGRHRPGGTKTPIPQCKYRRGQAHHAFKLTDALVRSIRTDRRALSYSQLASKYQLSIATVWKVCSRPDQRGGQG